MDKDVELYISKVEALKELVMARFALEEAARTTAYTELERRLSDLNHAHANMVSDRSLFVRLDIHDRFYQEYREWSQKVDRTLATQAGKSAAYLSLIGFLFVAIQIFLHYWK